MDFSKSQFEKMYNWNYSDESIMEITMEDLMVSPYNTLFDVFRFLEIIDDVKNYNLKNRFSFLFNLIVINLQRAYIKNDLIKLSRRKLPSERLMGIILQNDFKSKSKGRKQGEENLKHHYRKGVHGDWKNHFNHGHKEYFKKLYNDLIVKLGYEVNDEW